MGCAQSAPLTHDTYRQNFQDGTDCRPKDARGLDNAARKHDTSVTSATDLQATVQESKNVHGSTTVTVPVNNPEQCSQKQSSSQEPSIQVCGNAFAASTSDTGQEFFLGKRAASAHEQSAQARDVELSFEDLTRRSDPHVNQVPSASDPVQVNKRLYSPADSNQSGHSPLLATITDEGVSGILQATSPPVGLATVSRGASIAEHVHAESVKLRLPSGDSQHGQCWPQLQPSSQYAPHVAFGAQQDSSLPVRRHEHMAPQKIPSHVSRFTDGSSSAPRDQELMSASSIVFSEATSTSENTDLDGVQFSSAMSESNIQTPLSLPEERSTVRRPPDRHASTPAILQANRMTSGLLSKTSQAMSVDSGLTPPGPQRTVTTGSLGTSSSGPNAFPSASSDSGAQSRGARPAQGKQVPSRLSLAAGPRSSLDMGRTIARSNDLSMDGRTSVGLSGRLNPMHSSSLVTLQRTVESIMLQEPELLQKVQASMRGISSLAKETTNLEVGRDATGATCINQYVVVKTLGRGSFGKVKLCLNTMDGCLYAIKMVNRSFLVKQLQKPQKTLRRRVPTRNTSGAIASTANTVANTFPSQTPAIAENPAGLPAADVQRHALSTASNTNNVTVSNGGASSQIASLPVPGAHQATSPPATPYPASLAGSCEATPVGAGGTTAFRRTVSSQHQDVGSSTACISSRMSTEDLANPLESVMREIAVLKKLDHPNVVKLYEVIDPPGASYIMLVMEYMERGPVLETKGQSGFSNFPERIARDYFRQACAGLDYLHYNNVVHGDVKPENLLVSSAGLLKIGDFGSARIMSDSTANSKVSCTPAFQPPEALASPGHEDPQSADVWALGVCLYCFIYGRLPFVGSCLLDISNAIRNNEVEYPADIPISPELKDLFSRILNKDPASRLTLQGTMEHPWTTEQYTAPLPSMRTLLSPPKMIEVSRNDTQAAVDRSSFVNMIRARLKEKTFAPGEMLFREGDEAHCIYMIMAGVVEITRRLEDSASGAAGIDDMDEQSFSVDLDESFTLDCNALMPTQGLDIKDGRLHIDRVKAQALKDRMRSFLVGKQTEYVTEVKGPGQVIGDVGLDKSAVARHNHSARARDNVTVVKLTEDSFFKALLAQQQESGMSTALVSGAIETQDLDLMYLTQRCNDDESGGAARSTSAALTTILDTDDVSSL